MAKRQKKQFFSILLLIAIVLGVCIWLLCSTSDNLCWCNNPPCVDSPGPKNHKPDEIMFFMESSISVREYMETEEESFTEDINNFLAVLPRHCKSSKLKIYRVGSNKPNEETMEVESFNGSSRDFRNRIKNANGFEYSQSHLVNILDSITTYTSDSTVSFLVSDCIYSPKSSELSISEIKANLVSSLITIFQKINNNGLVIFKLSTNYDYGYYPESEDSPARNLDDDSRPYYVLAFGKPRFLRYYLSDTSGFKSDLAYDNYLTMNVFDNSKVKDSLFWNSGNQNCKPRPTRNTVKITSSSDENEMTRFLIGLDLKGLPYYVQQERYLEDKLKVTPKSGRLEGKDITVKNKENVVYTFEEEKVKAAQFTHFIEVGFSDISLDKTKLTVKLPFFLPNWYREISTNDDYPPQTTTKGKTYGFEYFVKGLKEGYGLRDSKFFKFNVTLKK